MDENLEVHLLGGFAVRLNGQPMRGFRTMKTRALLAYLAAQPDQEHSRVKLATLLWGELPDIAAKTNLRIELSNLKNLLSSHPALEIARDFARFRSGLATVDILAFRTGVRSFLALPVETQESELPRLVAAIDLYQGEFLAGFQLNDAIDFEDWQLILREQLHEEMMLGLNTLQLRYAEQGQWAQLANAARRQLALVSWTESAHRNLMQALAAQGQSEAALAQYEKCCEILQNELGVEPAQPTRELAARLRGSASSPPLQQHNLAQPMKSFVGRKEEIARVSRLVQQEKLVTLLGIGGVGKTHLAQAVAQDVLHDFGDGVWFVPLASIAGSDPESSRPDTDTGEAAPERIALAIAAAVGFQVTNLRAPLVELAGHLREKQMLLLLDNCDHLVEAVTSVVDTLMKDTTLHILATSRVRLMSGGEIPVQLEGLPAADAFLLFVDRSRRVLPSFSVEGHASASGMAGEGDASTRAADVYRICEQVAGLPLGIELAASWVEHYSVAEIGHSIAEMAVQPQQASGLVSRHHTLSNIFEYSWQLLNERHQRILTRLSLFRGGFDRTAAAAVAENALSDLSALIGYSLLQRVAAGRYDLHPLVREFAAQKLPVEQEAALHRKYSHHYLATLTAAPRDERAARLLTDFANIRSAWQRAVQTGDHAIIQPAVTSFGEFMAQFGLMADGNQLFAGAVERFGSISESVRPLVPPAGRPGDGAPERAGRTMPSKHDELVAQLLDQQSEFVRALHGLKAASDLQHRVLTLTSNRELSAKTHIKLVNYYAEVGAWEQVDFHSEQAETLAEELSDLSLYIRAVTSRIYRNALHFRGDFALGITRLEVMLGLLDTATPPLDDREEIRAELLASLTSISVRYGDYARAIRYGSQNLERITRLGHLDQRVWVLSDIALAELYAGMYAGALTHGQEALALATEIGSAEKIGILKVNFCLLLRQMGDFEQALVYGLEATEILTALGYTRIEGQARNRVGHTLLALERWADAFAAYGEAIGVLASIQHPNRYEAMAGRAVAALRLGKQAEALALVEEVLEFVASKGLVGIVEPVRLFLNCEAVLSGVGQRERGHQTLLQANDWVQTIAGRISDEQARDAFLRNRPDNLFLRTRMIEFMW